MAIGIGDINSASVSVAGKGDSVISSRVRRQDDLKNKIQSTVDNQTAKNNLDNIGSDNINKFKNKTAAFIDNAGKSSDSFHINSNEVTSYTKNQILPSEGIQSIGNSTSSQIMGLALGRNIDIRV